MVEDTLSPLDSDSPDYQYLKAARPLTNTIIFPVQGLVLGRVGRMIEEVSSIYQ